jgi:hypothetical protein
VVAVSRGVIDAANATPGRSEVGRGVSPLLLTARIASRSGAGVTPVATDAAEVGKRNVGRGRWLAGLSCYPNSEAIAVDTFMYDPAAKHPRALDEPELTRRLRRLGK